MWIRRLIYLIPLCTLAISCSKKTIDSFTFQSEKVYVCKGPHSNSYHFDKECEGLRSCTTEIFETEIESAQKKGRTLCGYEK